MTTKLYARHVSSPPDGAASRVIRERLKSLQWALRQSKIREMACRREGDAILDQIHQLKKDATNMGVDLRDKE